MRLSGPADFFKFILCTVCPTSSVLKGTSGKTSSFWQVAESRVEDCLIDSFSAGFVSSCDLARLWKCWVHTCRSSDGSETRAPFTRKLVHFVFDFPRFCGVRKRRCELGVSRRCIYPPSLLHGGTILYSLLDLSPQSTLSIIQGTTRGPSLSTQCSPCLLALCTQL